jgi:MOSC domain-containing protein YiiM
MKIVAIHVGVPRSLESKKGGVFVSSIARTTLAEEIRVEVGRAQINGDASANKKLHGGPEKAICCYGAEQYALWRAEFDPNLPFGAFGENLTIERLSEFACCIGDVYQIGSIKVQITQPRQPCVNLVKRWGFASLPKRMVATNATGFYLRVLEVGEIGTGDEIRLLERPNPSWTIAAANHAMLAKSATEAERHALLALPELSAEWRRMLVRRLKKSDPTEE